MTTNKSNVLAVNDDGHFNNKSAVLRGTNLTLYINQTLICKGFDENSLGNETLGEHGYETSSVNGNLESYTVLDKVRYGQEDYLCDTQSKSYQTSPAARVMVHHMLHKMGLAGEDVTLVVTSPISRFFVNGERNTKYAEDREKNLMAPVKSKLGESVNITSVIEYPEGWSAYQNMNIIFSGSKQDGLRVSKNEQLDNADVLILDFGGQTLDVAVMSQGMLIKEKSFSIEDSGMLAIHTLLRSEFRSYRENISANELDKVIESGVFRTSKSIVSSPEIDVREKVDSLIDKVLSRAFDLIQGRFNIGEFNDIVAVGGTAKTLDNHIKKNIPSVSVPSDAFEANAFGAFKHAFVSRSVE